MHRKLLIRTVAPLLIAALMVCLSAGPALGRRAKQKPARKTTLNGITFQIPQGPAEAGVCGSEFQISFL